MSGKQQACVESNVTHTCYTETFRNVEIAIDYMRENLQWKQQNWIKFILLHYSGLENL